PIGRAKMTSEDEPKHEPKHDVTGAIGHTENTYEQVLISALQVRISELEAALEAAHKDPEFMILNRTGIDARWHHRPHDVDTVIVVYIDKISSPHDERRH